MDPFMLFSLTPDQLAMLTSVAPGMVEPRQSRSSAKYVYAQRFIETAAFLRLLQDKNADRRWEDPDDQISRLYTFGSDPEEARRDASMKFNDSIAWLLGHAPGIPAAAALQVETDDGAEYTPTNARKHKLTIVMGFPEPEFFRQSQWGMVFAEIIGYVRSLSMGTIPRKEAYVWILRHVVQMKTQKLARYSNKVWISAGRLGNLGYIRDWIDRWLNDLQTGHQTGDFEACARSLAAQPMPPSRDTIDLNDRDQVNVRKNMRKMAIALEVAENLCNFATVCPDVFANADGNISQMLAIHRRVGADVDPDFSEGIGRVLNRIMDPDMAQALQVLLADEVPAFADFRGYCENMWRMSHCHAEMQFLHYLTDSGGFSPLYNYVGTTKVPCWCCKEMLEKRGIQTRGSRLMVDPGWITSLDPLKDETRLSSWVSDMRAVRKNMEQEIKKEMQQIIDMEFEQKQEATDQVEESDLMLVRNDIRSRTTPAGPDVLAST